MAPGPVPHLRDGELEERGRDKTMAGQIARVLVRSGWRLRCVDPPIGWMQVNADASVGVRIQLTCYLTSRWARAVDVKDLRLVLRLGERPVVGTWAGITDVAGDGFPHDEGYQVVAGDPQHALADFTFDDAEAVGALSDPGEPIEAVVQALLNDAPAFRKIADLELTRSDPLYAGDAWRLFDTRRVPRTRRNNNPPELRGD